MKNKILYFSIGGLAVLSTALFFKQRKQATELKSVKTKIDTLTKPTKRTAVEWKVINGSIKCIKFPPYGTPKELIPREAKNGMLFHLIQKPWVKDSSFKQLVKATMKAYKESGIKEIHFSYHDGGSNGNVIVRDILETNKPENAYIILQQLKDNGTIHKWYMVDNVVYFD
jgi:hypothetical protein